MAARQCAGGGADHHPDDAQLRRVRAGATPDYIGAEDYFFGGLPLARYQFEDSFRYASLLGTFVDLNLINHPIIRLGPTAQLRFGRSNVSKRAVRQLPPIGKTAESGVFGGLEFIAPGDPRKRLRFDLRGPAGPRERA